MNIKVRFTTALSPPGSRTAEGSHRQRFYGYVVVAPFHGDLRFSVLKINDLSDAIAVLLHLSDFTAMQALRPLSISAALDLVLAHPQWQDHLDATRIGGLGASKGDETMMLRRRRPGNPAAQRQLSTMASVAGGGDDSVVIYYNGAP